MLIYSALVAGSFSLGASVANEISPASLTALRFLIAAVVVAAFLKATGGLDRTAFRAPWRYLVMGGLFGLYFVLMFEALKTAAPVSTSVVLTLTPVLSAGFGYLMLRQIITQRMAFALAIGAAGALWVIFRADISAFLRFDIGTGEMIFLFGCLSHAIYTPLVRKLNRGEAPILFSLGTVCGGCIVLTLYGWRDMITTNWAEMP